MKSINSMKIEKHTWWVIGGAAAAVGVSTAAYFLFIKKGANTAFSKADKYGNQTLKKRASGGVGGGVKTATGNKGTTISEPNWNNPFDMNYEQDVKKWVAPKQVRVLSEVEAVGMAQALHEAKGSGWWSNDNEAIVKEVFQKRLRDKVQVANLSRAFWLKYQKDMWEYLNSFLSSSEMERYVHQPVRNLPNFRFITN